MDLKEWDYLNLIIISICIWELTSRLILNLENNGDFASLYHYYLTLIMTVSWAIGIRCLLSIHKKAEETCEQKTNSAHKANNNVDKTEE